MEPVVVTGLGIRSCLGNRVDEVVTALREQRSGLQAHTAYAEKGLRSHVCGPVDPEADAIPRRIRRFLGGAALHGWHAMKQAIEDARLEEHLLQSERTGIIAGASAASCGDMVAAAHTEQERGPRRVSPYMVPRIMTSAMSGSLATAFGIRGLNYSISSACATSAHCIGHAADQIRLGRQDVIFAGGGEEEHWSLSMLFDAMGALSTGYNDTPQQASRPFDCHRDGFVISGGAGILVLESLTHARRRGARIVAEVAGFGATSDGDDMVVPSGAGAVRCMKQAISELRQPVDYINAHATGTPRGDSIELRSIREVFGEAMPPVSSTKGLAGHAQGAAGVHEAIYSILMIREGFIAGNTNLERPDPEFEGWNLPRGNLRQAPRAVLSNSFGFGGTNAALVFREWQG